MTTEGAVVILSGGLDSTTCMAIAQASRYTPIYALSFQYGQRHTRELIAARNVAAYYGAEHLIIDLPFQLWGGSALTDHSLPVPRGRGLAEMAQEIPVTYVPGRNLVFLALAASFAEAKGITTIFFGANCIDYSGYADCRPEFLQALQKTLTVGTKISTQGNRSGLLDWKIETPLLHLGKSEIIRQGVKLGAPYHLSYSCYNGEEQPCGQCDSCKLRAAGFEAVGIPDPALR